MSNIYQLPIQIPGTVGTLPNQRFAIFGDSLASVTTASYLDQAVLQSAPLSSSDIIHALYNYDLNSTSGDYGIFTVAISGTGVITLSAWINPGDVTLPVVDNNFAVFDGTTGVIQDLGYYPSDTAAEIVAMVSEVPTQNSIATFSDAAGTLEELIKTNGTAVSNAVSATGNGGVITTESLTTLAGSLHNITWTNDIITSSSVVLLSLMGGTNTIKDIILQAVPGAGTCTLTVYNSSSSALNGTILIGYMVL